MKPGIRKGLWWKQGKQEPLGHPLGRTACAAGDLGHLNDSDCFRRWDCNLMTIDDGRVAMVNSWSVLLEALILASQDLHFEMYWGID